MQLPLQSFFKKLIGVAKGWFNALKADWIAYRNGHVRIAPRGSFGRTHAPAERVRLLDSRVSGAAEAMTTPTVKLYMKITRVDGSTEYREADGVFNG